MIMIGHVSDSTFLKSRCSHNSSCSHGYCTPNSISYLRHLPYPPAAPLIPQTQSGDSKCLLRSKSRIKKSHSARRGVFLVDLLLRSTLNPVIFWSPISRCLVNASTSLPRPSNTNAPIWSTYIEIHRKFLLGRLLFSKGARQGQLEQTWLRYLWAYPDSSNST